MQIIAESGPLELSGQAVKPSVAHYHPRRNYLVPVVGRAHTNDKRSLSLFTNASGSNSPLSIQLNLQAKRTALVTFGETALLFLA